MTLVFSFDVFDTCLARTVARPADLFFLLAERLLPPDATPEQVTELARLRTQAEAAARQASPRDDITLADIYRHFAHLDYFHLSPQAVMQAEIQLEQESVRLVAIIKQKIETLRRQQQRIIFISDMYLPQAVIRAMLLAHGLARPDDPIYVSGEVGLTKASGKLFEHVLAQEKIVPRQLHHTGDNPYADVIIPTRLGIITHYFQASRLNRYERLTLTQAGDIPRLQTQLAGFSRAGRLAFQPDERLSALTGFAANVAGPLLTAFVAWVLTDAQKRGIDRLYFVARDGQILWKIARQLAETTTAPMPECRYLYGSRQAWMLPSIFECDQANLDWLFLHATTPTSLLQKLELQPTDISEILAEYNFTADQLDQPLEAGDINRFWQVITHPAVSAMILQKAAAARQTTLAYFEQEGLLDSSTWALVDVGWALRGQRAVKKILSSAQPDADVFGYYLALADSRRPITETGPYAVFLPLPETAEFDSPVSWVLRNTITLEHLFLMADHGTTAGYQSENGRVEPVLRSNPLVDTQPDFVPAFHAAILHYAAELGQTDLVVSHQAELKRTALLLLKTFLSDPARAEGKMAARLPTVIDQTHQEAQYHFLTRRLGLTDFFYLLKYGLKRFFLRQKGTVYAPAYDWLAGSLAVSSWWMRLLFRPLAWGLRFKQNNGRWRIYHKWAKLVARKNF